MTLESQSDASAIQRKPRKLVRHYIVELNGKPCALFGKGVIHPAGAIAPLWFPETEWRVPVVRENKWKRNPWTTQTARSICRNAINRTLRLAKKLVGNHLAAETECVQRLLNGVPAGHDSTKYKIKGIK